MSSNLTAKMNSVYIFYIIDQTGMNISGSRMHCGDNRKAMEFRMIDCILDPWFKFRYLGCLFFENGKFN